MCSRCGALGSRNMERTATPLTPCSFSNYTSWPLMSEASADLGVRRGQVGSSTCPAPATAKADPARSAQGCARNTFTTKLTRTLRGARLAIAVNCDAVMHSTVVLAGLCTRHQACVWVWGWCGNNCSVWEGHARAVEVVGSTAHFATSYVCNCVRELRKF